MHKTRTGFLKNTRVTQLTLFLDNLGLNKYKVGSKEAIDLLKLRTTASLKEKKSHRCLKFATVKFTSIVTNIRSS